MLLATCIYLLLFSFGRSASKPKLKRSPQVEWHDRPSWLVAWATCPKQICFYRSNKAFTWNPSKMISKIVSQSSVISLASHGHRRHGHHHHRSSRPLSHLSLACSPLPRHQAWRSKPPLQQPFNPSQHGKKGEKMKMNQLYSTPICFISMILYELKDSL